MSQGNRADRILIGIAILILLLASGAYVFDDWMWGHGKKRGEAIGQITEQRGDVRLKYEDDLKWQRANSGEALAYNDAIYSGRGGEAKLQVGESHMVLTENTLVVLRRDTNVNFLNLHYGTLLGAIAKNDRVMIDTGSGKPVLLSSSKASNIVLRKEGKHTRLEVTSGEVSVTDNGKTTKLTRSSQYAMPESNVTPPPRAPVASLKLRALKPLKEQIIIGDVPYTLAFAWGWENNRAPAASEMYVVEFANDPKFGHIHAQRHIKGALETTMKANQSLSLYYRVRGPRGELSNVERVNFVATEKPLILRPVANNQFETKARENAHIPFQFSRPAAARIWYQISDAAEFTHVLVNENSAETVAVKDLPLGRYFVRARSDFGGNHLSAWTDPTQFDVVPKLEVLPLGDLRLGEHVLIPNHAYPGSLYHADPATVQSYLNQHGFLKNYFGLAKGSFDDLTLRLDPDDEILSQHDSAWPQAKLKPGLYSYKFQAAKTGFLPTPWSPAKKLEITMEPPKAIGQAQFGEPNADGRRPTSFAFTPLLFAASYDVEMARNANFSESHTFKVKKPEMKVALTPGAYFWRARARDAQGQLISAFSGTQKMASVPALPAPPAPVLAEQPPEPARAPAAVETVQTQVDTSEMQKRPWQRNGWWAWIGTGENYVDYRQTLAGTAAIDSHNIRLGSQYVEAGYVGDAGLGGVFAYKNTPGSFETANLKDGSGNVPITPNTYRWTTASVEAIAKRATPYLVNDKAVVYGMRVGFQQHQIPFLSLNADGTQIDLKNNQMTTASIGILGELIGRRWRYYGLMRYQFPLSNKADGATEFTLQPKFAFDGSLGASYNITSQVKLGLFAYGQWHQMNFDYTDATVHNTGFQSLFYSNVDVRLGFDF